MYLHMKQCIYDKWVNYNNLSLYYYVIKYKEGILTCY